MEIELWVGFTLSNLFKHEVTSAFGRLSPFDRSPTAGILPIRPEAGVPNGRDGRIAVVHHGRCE